MRQTPSLRSLWQRAELSPCSQFEASCIHGDRGGAVRTTIFPDARFCALGIASRGLRRNPRPRAEHDAGHSCFFRHAGRRQRSASEPAESQLWTSCSIRPAQSHARGTMGNAAGQRTLEWAECRTRDPLPSLFSGPRPSSVLAWVQQVALRCYYATQDSCPVSCMNDLRVDG